MAELAEGSSSTPPKSEKPVIVRVKRKASQSLLEAFWLEINERPLKRSFLDFAKLSISDSSKKAEEQKTKRVFVQHVETVTSLEVTADILQSFVEPSSSDAVSKAKNELRRHTFKTQSKHDKLLLKTKEKQELLAKNARFEQIWRSRKERKDELDDTVHEVYRLYDVMRVDAEEKPKEVQEQEDSELEDHRLMYSYLPLLKEFIPSAAQEVEDDIQSYVSRRASLENYVYDYYAVKSHMDVTMEDAAYPFPLVHVDDEDGFYDGPDDSECETDDSNAENNPRNDYPDEDEVSDDEVESSTSDDEAEVAEEEGITDKSSEETENGVQDGSDEEDDLYDDGSFGDGDFYDSYDEPDDYE